MNMPCPSDLAPDEGQPYCLSLLHALATASNDPDLKLVQLLAEGVPTGAVSELPRSMQWPPKPQADLPSELNKLESRRSGTRDGISLAGKGNCKRMGQSNRHVHWPCQTTLA